MGTLRASAGDPGIDFPGPGISFLLDDIDLCIVRWKPLSGFKEGEIIKVSAIEVELYPESHHI